MSQNMFRSKICHEHIITDMVSEEWYLLWMVILRIYFLNIEARRKKDHCYSLKKSTLW